MYAKSSYRVSKMFPYYPDTDQKARILKFYSWGSQESVFKPNFVSVNVPGAKYATGKVKFFSVDFGWTGLNNFNIAWTYEVASCIQEKKPLPRYLHFKLKEYLKGVRIPKNMTLKKIDQQHYWDARGQWKYFIKKGYKKDNIAKRVIVCYKEESIDDVDSLLIYRVLVELDRAARGWREGSSDTELYERLSSLGL